MDYLRIKTEKEYLKKVIDSIQREKEQQEKSFIEIPNNYKGRYAEVKWGDEDLVKNLQDEIRKRLAKLEKLPNNPYFGRIDFLEDGANDIAQIYVGKTSIIDEKNKLLTVDWRTPICTLYYDQSLGKVSYEAPAGTIKGDLKLKSQILIENGELIYVRDTDLVTNDELLMPYLTTNADARLKNIVASIQSEQNSIIRMPLFKNLIIQGVAGSGKTTIALHRIAYLLFNNPDLTAKNFVIIGPNKYFLNYISGLLPDLDTDNIIQFTFEEFAQNILEDIKVKPSDEDQVLQNILKFKSSLDYKEALDSFIKDYIHSILSKGIIYEGYQLVSGEDLIRHFDSIENFSGVAENLKKNLIQKIKSNSEKLEDIIVSKHSEYTFSKIQEIRSILKTGCSVLINSFFKQLKPNLYAFYKEFLSHANKYSNLTPKEITLLQKSTLQSINKKTFTLEDLPALLHLYITTYGDNILEFKNFKHLTIDEAQDFGLFHYYILKKVFQKCAVSIYGDLSQAIHSTRSVDDWNILNKKIFDSKCEILNINRSYRTTIEITNAANSILNYLNMESANPVIRSGQEVTYTNNDISTNSEILLNLIRQYLEKKYKSIGIICKDEIEMQYVKRILDSSAVNSTYITDKDSEYNGGICILTSSLAKGLEFDAIIIADASENKYTSNNLIDMKLLYVAMTRALHQLDIFYTGNISKPLEPELLKENSLENWHKTMTNKSCNQN